MLFGLVAILSVSILAASCSDEDSATGDRAAEGTTVEEVSGGIGESTDREAVVATLVVNELLSGAQQAAWTASSMREAIDALCAAPDAALVDAARNSVATAWAAWAYTDTIDLGPSMDRRSTSIVSYRADPERIDALLIEGPPADAVTVQTRTGAPLRGYGALVHLLGVPDASDPALRFAEPGRCDYLKAVAESIEIETSKVAEGWTVGLDGGDPFTLSAAGEGDDAYTPTEVIDSIVNMQLSGLEAGLKPIVAYTESGEVDPDEFAEADLFILSNEIAAMVSTYEELAPLLDGEQIDRLTAEFEAVTSALGDRGALPWEDIPTVQEAEVIAEAVGALRATIATEIVSALDVTIGFSDNDGDS